MARFSGWWTFLLLLIAVAVCLLTRPVAVAQGPALPPGLANIQHFVFIRQENRGFDHYFGTYPGAEGIPPGICIPDPSEASVGRTRRSAPPAPGNTFMQPATFPTTLGGVTVSVKDSVETSRLAQLAYVSPTQINYVVPTTTAGGNSRSNRLMSRPCPSLRANPR